MANPHKNPRFWNILQDLCLEVPVKIIVEKYHVSTASLAAYRDKYLETTIRIKDNIVDDTQMKFGFMYDNFGKKFEHSFNPNRESTFTKRWRGRTEA